MVEDAERCYRIISSRDRRYDGRFVVGVTSTGIYCRPSCPARTPRRANVRFYASSAAAQQEGFRACKRCRPEAAPAWRAPADVAGRAVSLIAEGVVEREGVPGLAARLGYSERQLHRVLCAELGAGPLALARAQRARTAAALVEATDWPLSQVALAAGFGSVRQFNATIREVYGMAPAELRRARSGAGPRGCTAPGGGSAAGGPLTLHLPARLPFDGASVLEFLGPRTLPGVDEVAGGAYRRTLALPGGPAHVALTPVADGVRAVLDLADVRDLPAAVARCRRIFDLDADVDAVAEVLGPLAVARPGLRVPGAADGWEVAVRAVLGQQVSVAAARKLALGLVERCGRFPAPGDLAALPDDAFPMPRTRRATLRALAAAAPRLEEPADAHALTELPGIGPWTAGYVALRLGDPDVFLPTDAGVLRALGATAKDAAARAESWRPWRSYATVHLWATL